MRAKQFFKFVFVSVLLAGFTYSALAGPPEPPLKEETVDSPQISQVRLEGFKLKDDHQATPYAYAPNGQSFLKEVEPNGTPAEATALGSTDLVAYGTVYPNADVDYYSFAGNAGDRVYAATMTSFSANASSDSTLQLISTDGVTVIETDLDDGSFGSLSSSIAGAVLPASGTYYLRVSHNSATSQLRPYHLHFRLQSGTPIPETEPNDLGQPLPASGWVSGDLNSLTDVDIYTLTLSAGDTVFLSLDLDPERDTVEWNGTLGLGLFNNFFLIVNDGGTSTPDSEAFFMTVKESGTYAIYVAVPTGGTTFGTYQLSASVHAAEAQACTTYTSTNVPVAIPTGPGLVSSTLTVPGNPRVGDLNMTLDIDHTNMPDLDVVLTSPAGNSVLLLTDIGASTQITMSIGIDDEAGVPLGLYTVVRGSVHQPELLYRLDWFDGIDAGGTWTLDIYDDLASNGGDLNGWSITVCDPPPPPSCPAGTAPTVVYSSDFEANDGGFTHSGTQDEWEWGTPAFAPITTCSSGVSCWKTDLDNTYNASSTQDLLSPSIDLTGYVGSAWVTWSQKYNIESASFDHYVASVRQAGGANPRTLYEWLGASMNQGVGSPTVTIIQSAGWGQFTTDISSYLGQNVEFNFHLDSDSTVQYTGLAIDDVTVTACEITPPVAGGLASTVTNTQAPDTVVTQTLTISNTGGSTLDWQIFETTNPNLQVGPVSFPDGGACPNVTDFPWLSTNPTNGSVAGLGSQALNVVFDSTGLTPNAYTGNLCFASNDPVTPQIMIPVTLTVSSPAAASIVMTKTVGTDPTICATTEVITVTYGTDVTYCYTVTNTGNVTLTQHTLTDSELGVLLNNVPYPLGPGAAAYYTTTENIIATTVNTATWEAYNAIGYSYNDTVPFNWVEISGTGTALNLTDDSEANVTMPFPFTYYGVTSDLIRVGNNGGILFNATTGDVAVTNATLPNSAHPLAMFPFWDDVDADTGNVYYETQGTAPNRQFIIEWYDRPHYSNTPGHTTFELILFESTNEILFNYLDVDFQDPTYDFGASATVGLNENASSALQYSYNTASLSDNFAILFTANTPAYASASDTATVIVIAPPVIEVNPESMSSAQAQDTVITQTLTIGNLGIDDLNWTVEEEAPALSALPIGQPTGLSGNPADAAEKVSASDALVSIPAPLSNFEVPADVLYDNGPLVTNPGAGAGGADVSALQTALGMTLYGFGHAQTSGFRVADDFTVPAGGWTLDQVIFYAYQTGSSTTSTMTGVNLRIWDGPPNAGGNIIWGDTTTNIMSSTTWSNIYRTLDTGLTDTNRPIMADTGELGGLYLPAGTYWLDWQTSGTLASGPWAPPVSVLGSTGTGNALQFDATTLTWNAVTDIGPQDFPFVLIGTAQPAVCATLGDIPWVSVSPTSGTTAGGDSSDVSVVFDSTGMSAGVYTGTLCINSNDPLTPLVTVPLTLTVEGVPVYGVALSGDDAGSGLPGTTVSYVVTITNTGNVADSYDLSASATWTTTPDASSVTLNPGESTTFTVDVDIPSGAMSGDSDVATISATSQTDNTATASTTLTTTVGDVYSVALSSDQAESGAPGETVTYVVTITNTGSTTDTFDLSAAGIWTADLSVASVTLAAGDSATFTVDVTIPGGAADGDSDDTVVTATSQSDASATDSATLTTMAVITPEEGSVLYIPLIFK
ncbi:MAG: proprotein convertase P-domain-containing protein [Anaerolineales bacterium]|nr:proprotein convertase P-domain-containing protein [Anaerolineales bacterium]